MKYAEVDRRYVKRPEYSAKIHSDSCGTTRIVTSSSLYLSVWVFRWQCHSQTRYHAEWDNHPFNSTLILTKVVAVAPCEPPPERLCGDSATFNLGLTCIDQPPILCNIVFRLMFLICLIAEGRLNLPKPWSSWWWSMQSQRKGDQLHACCVLTKLKKNSKISKWT